MVESEGSTFWPVSSESGNTILGEITIFHCLKCIFECINRFSALKKTPMTLELCRLYR